MKAIFLVSLFVAAAFAAKLPVEEVPPIPIVRSIQVNPDSLGTHNFEFESGNGIVFQVSGKEGITGGANMIGTYSYPLEDGTFAEVKFVADENGFQPQSDLLPVAPAFPFPIPDFVLAQIEKARLEDEAAEREARSKKA